MILHSTSCLRVATWRQAHTDCRKSSDVGVIFWCERAGRVPDKAARDKGVIEIDTSQREEKRSLVNAFVKEVSSHRFPPRSNTKALRQSDLEMVHNEGLPNPPNPKREKPGEHG